MPAARRSMARREIELDILGREVRTGTSVIHLSGVEQSLLYRRPRFIATVSGLGYRFIPTFANAGLDGAPASPDTPH